MPSATLCPACSEQLPDKAVFCHRCGTRTPTGVHQRTGRSEYAPPDAEIVATEQRRALQRAVGEACEVRELIGRGGFADVYAAWDVRLKREVAIKTLRPDIASPSMLDRFQREAEAVAMLRHPHIIPIYGVGEADGIAYFIMPRISGESLATVLQREKRLAVAEACRILCEAAGALDEAHRAGLVHRDIKPENVMLEGRDRRALVMDFGIAKTTDAAERLTATGMVMGTPQFMSPEQASGDRATDHRSDQYSLAMLGYVMLAGRLPFEGASAQTILAMQVTETPTPLHSVAPDVPERVAAVIERALAKRPEDRFPSIADFAAALAAASTVARDGGRARRRVSDLASRVARMRGAVPGWRHPLTLAALVAGALLVALTPQVTPGPAREGAALHQEAMFVARSHLMNRGVSGRLVATAKMETDENVYHFLRKSIQYDSIASLAQAGVPIWKWHVLAKGATSEWPYHIDLTAGDRIVRFEERLADTARAADAGAAAAESLAVAELAARGRNVGSLTRVADSTTRLSNRVDRVFTWRRPDVAVVGPGGDTAFGRITVRVTADRVTEYRESLALPVLHRSSPTAPILDILAGVGWLIVAGLVLYAMLAVGRERHDRFQWKPVFGVALFTLGCLGLGALPHLIEDLRFSQQSVGHVLRGAFFFSVFVAVAVMLLMVFGYAVGESIAAEDNLTGSDGVDDLVRGRLVVPEMATAATAGVALGVTSAGLEAAIKFGWTLSLGIPPDPFVPDPAGFWQEAVLELGLSVMLTVVLFSVQVLVWRRTRSSALAIVLPAVLITLLILGWNTDDPSVAMIWFLTTAIASFAVWRYGIVAGCFTTFLSDWSASLVTVAMIGALTVANVLVVVVLTVPLLLGWRSYRRFAAQSSEDARPLSS